jgi:hypothetical protein
LSLEQGEQDTDAGVPRRKLLHHFHPSPNLFETLFNEVRCSYVLPLVCRMTHVGQTGNSSEKHLGDDLVDPIVLSSVAAQNGALPHSRFPAAGQTQILNETKAGLELPWPRPIATIFSQRSVLVTLGTDELEELVLRVSLQHLSHELSDFRLNVVKKLSDTFEPVCGFIQTTGTEGLINGFFSC